MFSPAPDGRLRATLYAQMHTTVDARKTHGDAPSRPHEELTHALAARMCAGRTRRRVDEGQDEVAEGQSTCRVSGWVMR